MAAVPRKKYRGTELEEYRNSMQEFREMLERVGHKAAHRLKHPRFIDSGPDTPRRPRR